MWLDKVSAKQVLLLRDKFNIKMMVETGGAEGNNAIFYSSRFNIVTSVEIDPKLVTIARQRAKKYCQKEPYFYIGKSPDFLTFATVFRQVRIDYGWEEEKTTYLFILDAHTPSRAV